MLYFLVFSVLMITLLLYYRRIRKIVNGRNLFLQNAPCEMFDWFLYMLLLLVILEALKKALLVFFIATQAY